MATEYVGQPIAKVILRKKQFQWVLPAQKQFDIQLKEFSTGYGQENFRAGNAYYESTVGAMMVNPLYANRNNYVINSPVPNEGRYVVSTPNGIDESSNEKKKRVWRSHPTICQQIGSSFTDYKEPWEKKETDYSPLIEEEFMDTRFGQSSSERKVPVTWIHQKESNPNVEWFLSQEYGNFTNESFWIDVHKRPGDDPDPIPESEINSFNKFELYGEENEVKSFFAIRMGWSVEDTKDRVVGNYVAPVSNQGNFDYLGPFDIVFPIGKAPFIWDHQGDGVDPNEEGRSSKSYKGYIASRNDDSSWILTREIENFRLYFFVLKGKLIVKSDFSSSVWVFPQAIGSKASERTQARYENFFMPPGKTCILGRGFKFRFNYNPLEFDIYTPKGKEKKPHASVKLIPISIREDLGGGLVDMRGRSGENAVFMEIPYSKATRTPDGSTYTVDDSGAYGFDIVSDPYPGHGASSNSYTSMMIPVTEEPSDIRRLVKAYLKSPTTGEGLQSETNASYGIQTTTSYPVLFKNFFFTVDLNCDEPSFMKGKYTENIGKRFASPVVWRFRGDQSIPPLPIPEELDITNIVKQLSYNTDAQDYYIIRQNFKIECYIPKDYQLNNTVDDFNIGVTRDELMDWLQGGVREVEVSLGWIGGTHQDPALIDEEMFFYDKSTTTYGGKLVKVFTGLARCGPRTDQYAEDIVSLDCSDRFEILESSPILNSPIFDGMNVDKAFLSCATQTGIPQGLFDIVSDFAHRHILPMGYTFQDPKIRFDSGTSVFEAIQKIASFHMHVIRTEPDGTIILTDIYSNAIKNRSNGSGFGYLGPMILLDDLDVTHPSYVFYEDGSLPPNPFQRIYEQFGFDKSVKDLVNQIQIQSVDRTDGSLVMDGTASDIDSVENPNSKNFIGYRKIFRTEQPAFGDMAHIDFFRKLVAKHMFQAPMKVNFFTYGRPTIRPLDIIKIVHRDKIVLGTGEEVFEMKYRVISVSGTIDPTDAKYGYKIDIQAEHL